MKSKKSYMKMAVCLFVLFCSGEVRAQESLTLTGKAMLALDDSGFMISSGGYYYRVSKQGLSKEQKQKLESDAVHARSATFKVPRKSIEFVWPIPKAGQDVKAVAATENKVKLQSGDLHLKGTLLYSFAEPYYLVQSDGKILQISKSRLSGATKAKAAKLQVGDAVDFALPKAAVKYSWAAEAPAYRAPASIEVADSVQSSPGFLRIRGRLLYSASEDMVIIQAENTIFQLKKSGISSRMPASLADVGSQVELVVPSTSIVFYWHE